MTFLFYKEMSLIQRNVYLEKKAIFLNKTIIMSTRGEEGCNRFLDFLIKPHSHQLFFLERDIPTETGVMIIDNCEKWLGGRESRGGGNWTHTIPCPPPTPNPPPILH